MQRLMRTSPVIWKKECCCPAKVCGTGASPVPALFRQSRSRQRTAIQPLLTLLKRARFYADVNSAVSFSRLNLLDDACMLFITGVDLILCCNVLIYFDAISKKKGDSALLHQLIEKIEAAANSPLARQLHVVSLPALLVSEPPPLDEFQTIPTNRRLGHFYQWPESLARTSA